MSSYSADAFLFSPKEIDCHSISSGPLTAPSWSATVHYDQNSLNRLEDLVPLKNRTFDLASLTKVIVTSTLLVELAVLEGADSLEIWSKNSLLRDSIPELQATTLSELSVWDLWHHRSGLDANIEFYPARPFFHKLEDRAEAQSELLISIIQNHPNQLQKDRTIYSDVGFLLLGVFLERKHSKNLDVIWDDWCQRNPIPNSGKDKRFPFFHVNHQVPAYQNSELMETEAKSKAGVVNDDKAYYLGGVAPHAGLFGSVDQVSYWVDCILNLRQKTKLYSQWLTQSSRERFAFGWDTPSGEKDSHAGESAPMSVRGHLGYTGTSVWINPSEGSYSILLTNRVHPKASELNKVSIKHLRSRFYQALWQGKLYIG